MWCARFLAGRAHRAACHKVQSTCAVHMRCTCGAHAVRLRLRVRWSLCSPGPTLRIAIVQPRISISYTACDGTCNVHAVHMQRTHAAHTCSAHAVHMRCTCSAHAVHMQCTCGAHAVHMQCTCGAHAVHMRCTCGVHAHLALGLHLLESLHGLGQLAVTHLAVQRCSRAQAERWRRRLSDVGAGWLQHHMLPPGSVRLRRASEVRRAAQTRSLASQAAAGVASGGPAKAARSARGRTC